MDYDVINARCSGLVYGVARKASDNSKIKACNANKDDGPFFCSVCLSEAIVRKCTEKEDHFAHKGRLSPIIPKKDQQLHDKCRDNICNYLSNLFPNGKWASERSIPANKPKGWDQVIPDISGSIGNTPVAIEVQKTAYTIKKIHDKTVEYARRGVYVIWIVPLHKDLGDEPFRPRLYEKYLHSMYYGRVYYWTPKSNPTIIPVHFSPAKRWIDESTWFDVESGEERTTGGFYLTYKTLKSPKYGKSCDLAIDFKFDDRQRFTPSNQNKEIPESNIFIDKLSKWWPKDEYKDLWNQKTVISGIDFLSDYDPYDDYDQE